MLGLRGFVKRERLAVEIADKVLATGSAGRSTVADVEDDDPLGCVCPFDGKWKQIRALPHTFRGSVRPKVAELRPILQIW